MYWYTHKHLRTYMSKLHVHVFCALRLSHAYSDQSQESSQQEIWTPPQQKSEELLVWNPDFWVTYRFFGLIFQPEVVAWSIFPVAGYDDHTPDWCSQHMSWQQWQELSRFLHVNCDIRSQQKSSPKRCELCLPSLGAPKLLGITFDFLYP